MLPFECDPQDEPLDLIASCTCGQAIHFGDQGVWRYDGDYFCSAEYFARWSEAERMDGLWA